ncbi:hypothetical protein RA210_U10056 [Rubrivivax sp. A210]|uniref:hypothetical protein n=1 Tax=Rubrivivax sp. A210 TaxID=2772301 RepID=UPI00191B3AA7|nr:hypothetical protein [Rubrivivax sp. A210]CAD5365908.1 hypothetical protein RA210_U10056 [Rubrivivax sp. A210]
MNRKLAAVARLTASRSHLRAALVGGAGVGGVQALLGALVRDHPLGAAALALLLGGLAARLRPWRWLLEPELWKALLPQLMAALAQAPLGSWAEVMAALLRRAGPAEPGAEVAGGAAGEAASDSAQVQAQAPSPAPP